MDKTQLKLIKLIFQWHWFVQRDAHENPIAEDIADQLDEFWYKHPEYYRGIHTKVSCWCSALYRNTSHYEQMLFEHAEIGFFRYLQLIIQWHWLYKNNRFKSLGPINYELEVLWHILGRNNLIELENNFHNWCRSLYNEDVDFLFDNNEFMKK